MKHAPNPRRAELKALSALIRPLVKAGMYENVNAGLVEHWKAETGASEFHTFADWRKAGRPVRKGERGFPIWGTPRAIGNGEMIVSDGMAALAAITGAPIEEKPDFFPVCYLFHAGQVEPDQPTGELFAETPGNTYMLEADDPAQQHAEPCGCGRTDCDHDMKEGRFVFGGFINNPEIAT